MKTPSVKMKMYHKLVTPIVADGDIPPQMGETRSTHNVYDGRGCPLGQEGVLQRSCKTGD
ncbi:MAG: hypothetical protein MJ032_03225 [Acidaminococcaceae bacterium]|nr:hypothetical protein [Acidaminococcaceae bacterium]